MKKTLLTLGTIGAAALPVASVVSCGNKKKNTIVPVHTDFFKTATALELDKLPIDASDAGKPWSEGPVYHGFQQLENSIVTLAEMMGWDPTQVIGNGNWYTSNSSSDFKAKAWEIRKVETDVWAASGLPKLATTDDGDTLAEGGLNMVKAVFAPAIASGITTASQASKKLEDGIAFIKNGIDKHFKKLEDYMATATWTDVEKQLRVDTALGMDESLGAFGFGQIAGHFYKNSHSTMYMGEESTNNPWKEDDYGQGNTYYSGGGSWGSLNKAIADEFATWGGNQKLISFFNRDAVSSIFTRGLKSNIVNYATFPDKTDPAKRYISFTYFFGGGLKIRKVMRVDNYNYTGNHKITSTDTMKIYDADGQTVLKTSKKELVMKEMLSKIVEKSIKTISAATMQTLSGLMHDGSYSALEYILKHAHDANNSIFADESLTPTKLNEFYALLNKGQTCWPALYGLYVGLKNIPDHYTLPAVAGMHTYTSSDFNVRPKTSENRPNYQGLKDSADLKTTLLAWAHKSRDSIYWVTPGAAAAPASGTSTGSGAPLSGSNPAK